jgi:hypothetical protein
LRRARSIAVRQGRRRYSPRRASWPRGRVPRRSTRGKPGSTRIRHARAARPLPPSARTYEGPDLHDRRAARHPGCSEHQSGERIRHGSAEAEVGLYEALSVVISGTGMDDRPRDPDERHRQLRDEALVDDQVETDATSYVAINVVSAPAGAGATPEQRIAARKGAVEGSLRFERIGLLRPVESADVAARRDGGRMAAGHAGQPEPPEATYSTLWGFEGVQSA